MVTRDNNKFGEFLKLSVPGDNFKTKVSFFPADFDGFKWKKIALVLENLLGGGKEDIPGAFTPKAGGNIIYQDSIGFKEKGFGI